MFEMFETLNYQSDTEEIGVQNVSESEWVFKMDNFSKLLGAFIPIINFFKEENHPHFSNQGDLTFKENS